MTPRLNLLPARVQTSQLLWDVARTWLCVGAAAAVVALAITWQRWSEISKNTAELEQLRQSQIATRDILRQVKQSRLQLQATRRRETVALSLASEQPALTLLGVIGAAVHDTGEEVAIERLSLQSGVPPAPTGSDARAITEDRVELRGIGTDDVALTQFVANLRAKEVFARVDLKSTGSTKLGQTSVRSFVIECAF